MNPTDRHADFESEGRESRIVWPADITLKQADELVKWLKLVAQDVVATAKTAAEGPAFPPPLVKRGRLRWTLEPRPRGLAAVAAGPRGSRYHDGETEYASVAPLSTGYGHSYHGWYYWASVGEEHVNTSTERPFKTADGAKQAAEAWVKRRLNAAGKEGGANADQR